MLDMIVHFGRVETRPGFGLAMAQIVIGRIGITLVIGFVLVMDIRQIFRMFGKFLGLWSSGLRCLLCPEKGMGFFLQGLESIPFSEIIGLCDRFHIVAIPCQMLGSQPLFLDKLGKFLHRGI